MSSQKLKKIIFSTLFIVMFGFFASVFLGNISTVTAQTESNPGGSSMVGQDILDLLVAFNSVSINNSIFTSQLFKNLKDFKTSVQPEIPGRSNPFAPIGSVTTSGASKTIPNSVTNTIKVTR